MGSSRLFPDSSWKAEMYSVRPSRVHRFDGNKLLQDLKQPVHHILDFLPNIGRQNQLNFHSHRIRSSDSIFSEVNPYREAWNPYSFLAESITRWIPITLAFQLDCAPRLSNCSGLLVHQIVYIRRRKSHSIHLKPSETNGKSDKTTGSYRPHKSPGPEHL